MPAKAAGDFKLASLRAIDADVTLDADDVVFGGQHYRALDTHVQLAGGKLAINPFRAQAPEGAIIGGLSLDASVDVPPVAISLRSPSLSAGAIAELGGFPGGASGAMQVDAQLSGTGDSVPAIEGTLAGHLGLAMVNGQVDNTMIETLIGDALHTAGISSLGGGESQVRCFALRMDFAAGLGSVRSLALDSSHLVLDGDGWIDLRGSDVDLHLRPQVRIGSADVTAPVSLKGPFGHLKAALDPVMGGGRVGFTLNGGVPVSDCSGKLALARNGLPGPAPAAPPPAAPFKIRKPKDLLKGLFH